MKYLKRSLLTGVIFSLLIQISSAQMLEVHVKSIQTLKGQLCIAVFANQAGFNDEKTVLETKFQKELVVNGNFDFKIPIKPGRYGVSVLDDVNKSGKMEYRLLGIPREGFGFSDYIQKGIRKPKFDDFSFVVEKNEIKTITVVMKYF